MTEMLTKDQAAIIGAYTGVCCGSFSDIHELAEKVLCRPVFTHEFATKELTEELKEKTRQMFIDICYKESTHE